MHTTMMFNIKITIIILWKLLKYFNMKTRQKPEHSKFDNFSCCGYCWNTLKILPKFAWNQSNGNLNWDWKKCIQNVFTIIKFAKHKGKVLHLDFIGIPNIEICIHIPMASKLFWCHTPIKSSHSKQIIRRWESLFFIYFFF